MNDFEEYKVGRFTLQPFRQLLESATPVSIGKKPLELLSVLAKAEGALVTKDELMAAVWPNAIVEDNALQVHVGALRKLLGAEAELLSTVHGFGYRLVASQQPSAAAGDPAAAETGKGTHTPILVAAAATAMMAVALIWVIPQPKTIAASPAVARVAVLPFDTLSDGPQARHFADSLTDEIETRLSSRIQVVSRDDAATLRGADRDRKVAELGVSLLLDGTVQDDGKSAAIRVHLDDPVKHATLWSDSINGPAANGDPLRATIANTIVAVLACANRALAPAHGLTDPELLSRYLRACDILVNGIGTHERAYEVLASLREVATKAPGFAPIHSDFAKYAPLFFSGLPPDQAAALRQEVGVEAHKALALDPKSPDAYLGLSQLLPPTDWAGREKLLRQGVASDPDWPFTNGVLGLTLSNVGRLREATGFLQKAVATDLQFDFRGMDGVLQCGSGQFEPMTSQLVDASKLEARYNWVGYTLRRCLKYARRWADLRAIAMAPPSQPLERASPRSSIYDIYLVAEMSGKPADIARARSTALAAAASGDMVAMSNAIEALSALGFTDDAFAVANRYMPTGSSCSCDSEIFFFTLTAPLRRDPRFMQLAARLGMVDYWRTSGHWPDFCSEPGLPYDCRAMAAKVSPLRASLKPIGGSNP